MEVTEALKEKVSEKLDRLTKFLHDDTNVHVTMSVQKLEQKLEITIPIKGTILRTEVADHDMYAALDKATDILEKQVTKYRSKLKDKHKHDNSFKDEYIKAAHDEAYAEEVNAELKISKTKCFDIKPMLVEEAIMQMNLLGHDFFMFKNMESDKYEVVYTRKGGTYGLITPDCE